MFKNREYVDKTSKVQTIQSMGGLASGISLLQTIGMTIDFQSKLKGEEVAFGDKAVLALWILIGLEVISILAVYMTTNRVIKSKKLEMSEAVFNSEMEHHSM